MIQNLFVACGLALSVGVSSLNSNDHNTDTMRQQSTTIYDGGITEVNTTYEYQTNEVNSIDDFVEGNIYEFTLHDYDFDGSNFGIYSSLFLFQDVNVTFSSFDIYINVSEIVPNDSVVFEIDVNGVYILNATLYVDDNFYFIWSSHSTISDVDLAYIGSSSYLGNEVTTVTNTMPTSLLQIFDQFINERIFNHSTLTTLKTTIFGQEMSVASWLSLSVSIVLGILFIIVLIKGAIWLFKIVGNIALLR